MNDALPLALAPGGLVALNVILACLMFGVSLGLTPAAFRAAWRSPRAAVVGLAAQYVAVPALTCLLAWGLRLDAPLALGMILVAACPGGSFSNVLTWMARGNVPLAVGLTAVSSMAAPVVMPLNFALYGWLNPVTRPVLRAIEIPAAGILTLVLSVLVVPLLLGMATGRRVPRLAARVERPLRAIATTVFLAFVALAFSRNLTLFVERFDAFVWLVVAQNLLAMAVGFGAATLARLPEADRRALTIEVSIHNTGLGLAVLFTFFPRAGGMMLITAFWGVWHLVSGLAVAQWWARRPLPASPAGTAG